LDQAGDYAALNFQPLPLRHRGTNANNQYGLWVTDGTASGTHELTGIEGASLVGFGPQFLTAFDGVAIFDAIDAADKNGLWMTDGTAAGTHEITGISGAGDVFNPTNFTVLNDKVLFTAYNTSGQEGLWVTDGTAAGTHELDPIGGASSYGLEPSDLLALQPSFVTVSNVSTSVSVPTINSYLVEDGGTLKLASGSDIAGLITISSGGKLEVGSSGSTGRGAITFAGGGALMLDDSVHFGGLVANFGPQDKIDLADIPFVTSGGPRRC
jgi:ELWxxDGT repeat protein